MRAARKGGSFFMQTKSTSKIEPTINEVLRVGMSHNRNTQVTKSIMTYPSLICNRESMGKQQGMCGECFPLSHVQYK